MRTELVPNRFEEHLAMDIDLISDGPCIVLCHGFSGHKRVGITQSLYEHLKGMYSVCTFDFSGNGESEGEFDDATFEKEALDLEDVLAYLKNLGQQEFVLVGHSMGGSVSFMAGENHPNVVGIVMLAAPINGKKVFARIDEWFVGREIPLYQIPGLRLNTSSRKVTANLIQSGKNLDILTTPVHKPILGVYSKEDKCIPFSQSTPITELGGEVREVNSSHNFMSVASEIFEIVDDFVKSLS